MDSISRRISALTPAQRQALLARLKVDRDAAAGRAVEGIPRLSRPRYPVSFAQEQMWFLHRLEPDGCAYNGSTALRLTGPLDVDALEGSLAAIVDRHEILRSTFEERDGQVFQVPGRGAFQLERVELTGLASTDAAVRDLLLERAGRPFDLAAGPLFRGSVVRRAGDEHVLLLTAHHIVSDGWSIDPLVHELSVFYAALVSGQPATLPPLPIQYGDYAAWERGRWERNELAEQLAYWQTQLHGAEATIVTPDRPRSSIASRRGRTERLALSAPLSAAIRSLSRETGTTLFMTMLAAFTLLLRRYTGQSDICVGTPIANRAQHELEPLIGFFANLVALRTTVTPGLRFRDLLQRVREVALGAYEHQALPFAKLVEELSPTRDGNQNPFARVAFAVQAATFDTLRLSGVTSATFDLDEETTRFDIELHAADRRDGIELSTYYGSDLFERQSIARLLTHFVQVLEAVTANPDVRVADVSLLPAEERARTISSGVGRPAEYPPEATLASVFATVAARHAAAIAIVDGDARVTYADLASAAHRLAHVLRSEGVGPNVAVGIWQDRDARLITTVVGIVTAGGAYVPLDPRQPSARAAAAWADAGVRVVVTTDALTATVPDGPWQVVSYETALNHPGRSAGAAGRPDDLAYVLFTSGSTGRPKGVAVPQRAVLRLVCGTDYVSLGPGTVIAQAATAAFDAATFEIWGALLNGGRLVIVPTDVTLAPSAFGAYLQRSGVTTLFLTTALIHQIGAQAPSALNSVDDVLFGGEAVEPRWIALIKAAGGPRRLLHVYGPTETTTFASWFPVETVGATAATIPIGGPIADTELYVLDDTGAIAPVGVPGELHIGGIGLAHGYIGVGRLTAERFVPDGVSGSVGARLYRTGDIVRWVRPGVLDFVGRRDGQIKLRGHRIELTEIEAALRAIEGVAAAVAIVDGTGESRRILGYVAPRESTSLDGAALRVHLQATLPAYMVPAAVVVLDALPLNANGKLDRAALPSPDAIRVTAAAYVAPRSRLETQIARIWRDVLGTTEVGAADNFFDLGGHSLLLVRVQSGLEAALGRRVPLVSLFQYPTVAALAAHLGENADEVHAVEAPRASDDRIAIVGMAGRFPGAPSVEAFWENLRAGVESIRRFTQDELRAAGVPSGLIADPHYVAARGALADADLFDAELFGYAPRDASLLDPQQRLMLECAWEALERAGYAPGRSRGSTVGVYAGASVNTYLPRPEGHRASASPDGYEWLLGNGQDFLATRVSYKLGLTGPAVTVQTACSTSLVAVHSACQALRAGECDMALAGGVSVTVPLVSGYQYTPDGIASPDGHCRPFDAQAAGTVAGHGVGVVVLKRLSRAVADGDVILAVIRGSAINNDGSDKVGFTAPGVNGQAAVIAAAQAVAGVRSDTIGCVEAHGTGTALGDPIEVAALRQVFGEGAGPGTCALASVKSNIGHLDAAAGVTALIKVVLALVHRELPPSLHFRMPNPQLDLGPFYVPAELRPWMPRPGVPRRAGVSSFGIGGTNAHVIVEEAPARSESDAGRPWQVVPISAQSVVALDAAAAQLAGWIETHPETPLADVAYTMQTGRAAQQVRRVAVGSDAAVLATGLRNGLAHTVGGAAPPVVWVFPGQGTQLVDMAKALYQGEAVFRAEFDACAEAVTELLGIDLREVLYPAPTERDVAASRLSQTTWTQVALVAVELSLSALWRSWGVQPAAVIGHSVGELAAACVAGVLTRDSAVRLAAVRGRLMQAAPPGGMLAAAAGAEEIRPLLGADLWLAAINGVNQTVVAGTDEALHELDARLRREGRTAQRLNTAGAFHSGLMAAVVEPLTAAAAECEAIAPRVPWFSTVTGDLVETAPTAAYWGSQVTAPVQWAQAVARARAHLGAAPVWLEIGPGHTLCGLVRAGAPQDEITIAAIDGPDAAESTAHALAACWLRGVAIDWDGFHAGARRHRLVLPTYPFQRQRYWIESPRTGRSAGDGIEKDSDPARWFYTPGWIRMPIDDSFAETPVVSPLVFVDTSGLGELVAAALERAGCSPVRVRQGHTFEHGVDAQYTIDPHSRADHERLLDALAAAGRGCTHVLHCWGTDPGPAPTATNNPGAAADPRSESALLSLLYLAQALGRDPGAPVRVLALTGRAQDVTGDEPLQPERAAIAALARVVAQEHPHVRCWAADVRIDGPISLPATARQLAAELIADDTAASVAYRHGQRWVECHVRRAIAAPASRPRLLRERGTYLITGGLGRIGLRIAEYLARSVQARVVLASRTAVPEPHEWDGWLHERGRNDATALVIDRLREIRAAGAEVLTVAADVADPAELRRAVAAAERRFGALSGVIHLAADTDPSAFTAIDALDPDLLARHFRAKVSGASVLADAVAGKPLDFVLLASSLSTVLGGLRFGAYAAANAALDTLASVQARRTNVPWMSVNWDGWGFEQDRADTSATARLALTPDEGVEAFRRIMNAAPMSRTVVSTADLHARIASWVSPRTDSRTGTATPPAVHERSANTAYVAPGTDTETVLAGWWAELLGIDRVGVRDDFFELGGHSLLGTRLMSRVRERFGVDLPLSALFALPTVAALGARLDQQRGDRSIPDRLAKTMLRLSVLPPDERAKLLREARQARASE